MFLPLLLISLFYFFISPRSQNQRMDGWWVCHEQLGVWCNPVIGFLPSSPYFRADGEIAKFCRNFDFALIWRVVITKQLNI